MNLIGKQTFFDNSQFPSAYQDVNESRNSRDSEEHFNFIRTENVDVFSVNADFNKRLNTKKQKQSFHNLSYGLEWYYNTVTSTAFRRNVNTLEESPADTRYPDGDNSMNTFAVYVQDS
ncbi:MAG: hypothetical protein R3A12_03105 [Ignavibacteria bacterium]